MSKRTAIHEERLKELRRKLAPTLAEVAIQAHLDREHMKAVEKKRRPRGGGPKAA